jgi:hypothetical protein
MPTLHAQFLGQAKTPDGNPVQLAPPVALQQRGPVVQVSLTVEENIAKAVVQQGKQLPAPITGFALIDTGASVTCIDDESAQRLGLPVIDVAAMSSVSHASTQSECVPRSN